MAPPLASLFLILAASASAADCPIPTFDDNGSPRPRLPAEHASCALMQSVKPEYDRLVRTAGLVPAPSFSFHPSAESNAYYFDKLDAVRINYGFAAERPTLAQIRTVLAHELGHAVQARGPEGRERRALFDRLQALDRSGRLEPRHMQEWADFSRRYEAQADGIAQQLLATAGFPAATARVGTQQYFGCGNDLAAPLTTHPSGARRVINTTFGQSILDRNATALASPGFFDGARARGGGATVGAGLRPGRFTPAVKLSDFDAQGRLLPGRLVAGRMRVPMPHAGPGPNPVRGMAYAANGVLRRMEPSLRRSVDAIARRESVTQKVLTICRTGDSDALARDFGVSGWTRRIAADKARKAAEWLGSWLP